MLSKRELLFAGAAAAAFSGGGAARAEDRDAALATLFDRLMDENLEQAPEQATALGLDSGAHAGLRSRLAERSVSADAANRKLTIAQYERLEGFDAAGLSPAGRLNRDIILYGLRQQAEAAKRYPVAGEGLGSPYVLSQLGGEYLALPDFLDSAHKVETKADAEAYLARLRQAPKVFDQEVELSKHDASLGVVPPDFVLDKTAGQLQALRDTPADQAVLVQALVRKTKEAGIAGDHGAAAAKIYAEEIQPALDRQIAWVKSQRQGAVHDAGVWRLPKGEAYYADCLAFFTTTAMTPAEIHQMGLDMVADYQRQMDTFMQAHGFPQKTREERMAALFADSSANYPNTDEGKARVIEELNARVRTVRAKLPDYFGTVPKADVEIRRIPAYTEASAPGGYYNPPALDGSRPGVYYLNLQNLAQRPPWTMRSLTYHEAIPGHHLQLSLQQEAALPLIRKASFYAAYMEGWGFYAEQLADEMGMYADDPLGRISYLRSALFRAVRLVVDTGIHAKRWSREQAIEYMKTSMGSPSVAEVERYCVTPGQACAYMIGKVGWLKNRDKAKAALGQRFDIRKFHDAGLLAGAMPLAILDQVIDEYIRTA